MIIPVDICIKNTYTPGNYQYLKEEYSFLFLATIMVCSISLEKVW